MRKKTINLLAMPDCKANKKTIVITKVWHCRWYSQICQWNKVESSEIDSHKIQGPDM